MTGFVCGDDINDDVLSVKIYPLEKGGRVPDNIFKDIHKLLTSKRWKIEDRTEQFDEFSGSDAGTFIIFNVLIEDAAKALQEIFDRESQKPELETRVKKLFAETFESHIPPLSKEGKSELESAMHDILAAIGETNQTPYRNAAINRLASGNVRATSVELNKLRIGISEIIPDPSRDIPAR